MPVSMRACTDSFCNITFTLKCLPTSRRKSIRRAATSQSALFTNSAAAGPGSKSRKRLIWSRWRCKFSRICSFESSGRSPGLPLGSPEQEDRHEIPELQARRGRIEATVHGAPAPDEIGREALRGVVDEAAPLEFGEEIRHGAESYENPQPLASAERPR